MKDKIYIGEGIMALINKPLYYDNFTFDDLLEVFQHANDCLCEDFCFQKITDWNNKQSHK